MKLINAGAREGQKEVVHDTALTWPNVITLLRFLGLPLFIWLIFGASDYIAAFIVIGVVAATDWIDGYIARRFDQVSRLGKMIDPIADRLLLVVVIVSLVAAGIAPWWILAAILVPDLVLTVCSAVFFRGSPELSVTVIGKIRTALLLVGTPLLLAGSAREFVNSPVFAIGMAITVLGCVGHLIACFQYLRAMVRVFQARPGAGVRRPEIPCRPENSRRPENP
ncbi:CDP-alcohol phosphatidyltransferase family protein [Saxibacter everestensis]|uniref:CDP-alcohol phosphatidyltransferase family protein n=1 Tax=Saxibacter everestensis TaxID=2909229 RepID=A0ABY8QPY5_9MICO|nr:CDP-alcohol phosphatidyltransferase family protein [Brevibacteriaceae bacterium ZFBP1038]